MRWPGRFEIVVERFPAKGGKWTITTEGGQNPTWRADTRELLYSMDDTLFARDINPRAGGFEWGGVRRLFPIPNFTIAPVRGFVVSADGQRFVAVVPKAAAAPQRLTTILNWAALLK